MKIKIAILAVIAALTALPRPVAAQQPAFGGGTSTSNILVGNTVATNNVNLTLRPIFVQESGATNPLTTWTGTIFAGTVAGTNGFAIGAVTNIGTNTFSTNYGVQTVSVPIYVWLQSSSGSNTVVVLGTYGP